jgi:hypothetical protein
MALLAHSPCQAQGLQQYILEADESGLTAALTKLKGMLADEDHKMSMETFLSNVSKKTSEEVKAAHVDLSAAQESLRKTYLAVGIDPDPLSLLADGDLLRRQSCAMTVKWACYTLMQNKATAKVVATLKCLHMDHLQNALSSDAKDQVPVYSKDFIAAVETHLEEHGGQVKSEGRVKPSGAAVPIENSEPTDLALGNGDGDGLADPAPKKRRKRL